jgi:hypothetical protein
MCDLTAGTKDMEGKATGVCRVPTPCPSGTGGSAGSGGSSGGMNCLFAGGDTYVTCVETACDSQFKAAFGDGYKTAPAGPCDSFMKCMSQAGCTQAAAQGCAGQATPACQQALGAAESCVNSNAATCLGGLGGMAGMAGGGLGGMAGQGGTGPGMECSLLKSCCDTGTFPDPSIKDTCNKEVADGNETVCSSTLFSYKSSQYCM